MHKECTCLSFIISARNVAITKKCLKVLFRVRGGGGGGGGEGEGTSVRVSPLYQSLRNINV